MRPQTFLFLDFDGTLAPIVKTPQAAKLSASRRKALKQLTKKKDLKVFIVSGRELSDLKKRVGVKGFTYVGNHGFEMDGWVYPKAKKTKKVIAEIVRLLKKETEAVKGAIVENKKYSASVHYRLVKKPAQLKNKFKKIIRPFVKSKTVRVTDGKKVFEIRPPFNWDKGKAVLMLLKKFSKGKEVFPIYIGDDTTDEDAFLALSNKGRTVCVGPRKKTAAKLRLKSVNEVYRYLSFEF